MSSQTPEPDSMPAEINFRAGKRGLHHVPPSAKSFVPVAIEHDVWDYFAQKAAVRGTSLSELITEILQRDIEIHEALANGEPTR
ncbi:MAG: hypothetical protein ABL962_17530 [Fimbriimonadaceae bacterium]